MKLNGEMMERVQIKFAHRPLVRVPFRGKIMLTKNAAFLFCSLALSLSAVVVPMKTVEAQGQPVTGFNLGRAEIPGDNGTEVFNKMPDGSWVQIGGRGEVRTRFEELSRDANSVFLYDRSRNFRMQIDLSDQTMSFRDPSGNRAVFARMTAVYAIPPASSMQSGQTQATQTPRQTQVQAQQMAASASPTDAVNDANFDPFRDPATNNSPTSTALVAATQTQFPRTQAPTLPEAMANRLRSNTQSGPGTPQVQGGATTPGLPDFTGIWVDNRGSTPRRATLAESRLGTTDPTRDVTYMHPRSVRVQSLGGDQFLIELVNSSNDFDGVDAPEKRAPQIVSFSLRPQRQADGSFTLPNGAGTVRFLPGTVLGGFYLDIAATFPQSALINGRYRMASLLDGATLSRDRFDEQLISSRLSATEAFNNQINQSRFNANLYGYNVLDMSPEDSSQGQGREPIFGLSSNQRGYSYDGSVGKSFPYGLRGILNKRAVSAVAKVSFTNERDAQKEVAKSMGGNIMGLGLKFTKERSTSIRNSQTIANEFSFQRSFRYTVYLDLPNIQIDAGFRDALDEVANKPVRSAADIANILDTYGTHYANAIAYGGSTNCSERASSSETVTTMARRNGIEMSASTPRGGGNLGNGEGTTDGITNSQSTLMRTCDATGGRGIDGNWQLDDDDSIPLLYDLRPIYELINVITFPDVPLNQRGAYQDLRARLRIAIDQRQVAALALSDRALRRQAKAPEVWDVTFTTMECTHTGDRAVPMGVVNLLGKIDLELTDVRGVIPVQTFGTSNDQETDEEKFSFLPVTCASAGSLLGPLSKTPINKTVRLLVRPDLLTDGMIHLKTNKLIKFVPRASHAGADAANIVSRGHWVTLKVLDAIFGDTIKPGGLAPALDNEIDKIRGPLMANSVRISTPDTSVRLPFGFGGPGWRTPNENAMRVGGGEGEPYIFINWTAQRIE
jgi:hypothetical protein